MNQPSSQSLKKPTSADEVMQCLFWIGWDPSIAFDAESKQCLNLKPHLIRESIKALRERSDLSRYTHALSKIVELTDDDDVLRVEWKKNLPQLRALMFTSARGTDHQRLKLMEIARNKQIVKAMQHALRQESMPDPRKIEPSWIAVLYADGQKASILEADRFNTLLEPKIQVDLRGYRDEAAKLGASRDA